MNQYCRYCEYIAKKDDTFWCEKKETAKTLSSIRSTTMCKDYSMSRTDVIGKNKHGYMSREDRAERRKKPKRKTRVESCMLTEYECAGGDCYSCGWNEDVARERKNLLENT